MHAELIYNAEGKRRAHALQRESVTIGRAADSDLVIQHQSVSRRHARIEFQEGQWYVVDLGSSNGTRVNDRKIDRRPLRHGDRILLGRFPIGFHDPVAPGVSLIAAPAEQPIGTGTVFQQTVDFSALASGAPDVLRLQKLLAVVTQASKSLLSSPGLDETLNGVLELVFGHLPVERGFIMLWDEQRQDLITRCVRHKGVSGPTGADDEIRFSRTIAEKVYRERMAVLTTDALADERFADGASIMELGIRSAMAAPLWHGDRVDGLIYVDSQRRLQAFDRFDLDLLSALGNHVAVALEHFRLQESIVEQQVMRRRLARYHSPAVVERITRGGSTADRLVAEEREVTVLFADVVGFTQRCERLEPREVAELLNRYFSAMTEAVFHQEGTVDKFIGDCLMAVFGAPLPTADHAVNAVDAALEMRDAMATINEPLASEARLAFRVGMHSGKVVAGDIGSLERRDYTVLGATVNLAARLESAVAQSGQIVVSQATADALGNSFDLRPVGEHHPRGTLRPVRCYEVVGHLDEGKREEL